MRWILPVDCLPVLTVIVCGCIQPPSAALVTPVPGSGVPVVVLTGTTIPPHPVMGVNISAEKTPDSVIIRIDGGTDAGALTSLSVHIDNYDGTSVQRTIPSPKTGTEYRIEYFRDANAANVNIVGTFSDGYQQTLLMTAV